MKLLSVILLTTLLTCIQARKNRNKEWKVNEGASTSRESNPRSETQDETCRVNELIDRRLLLEYGRSINYDGNLTAYAQNYPEEIIVIYDENDRLELLETRLKVSSKVRKEDFEKRYKMKKLEILYTLKKTNHHPNIQYTVDVNKKTIINISSHPKNYLCKTAVAKKEVEYMKKLVNMQTTETNTMDTRPRKKKQRPFKLVKIITKKPEPKNSGSPRLSHHHIVSANLLLNFFSLTMQDVKNNCLKDGVERPTNNSLVSNLVNVNNEPSHLDCSQLLYLREKSFKVMMLIGIILKQKKKLSEKNMILDIDIPKFIADEKYCQNFYESLKCWLLMGDNIVEGPEPKLRGPFDPNMRYHKHGFEDDIKPIIGEKHYHIAQKIDEALKRYIKQYPLMSDEEKKSKEKIIINFLEYSSRNFQLTPYNPDQWEKRYPTKADLDRLKDQKLRKTFENKMFWDIKKPSPKENQESESDDSERSKRSLTVSEDKLESEDLDAILKRRLMEFVLVSLEDQIEADLLQWSLEWSNDLKNLYDQYLFDDWIDVLCPDSSSGFDHFLYSKMIFKDQWLNCIAYNKQINDETDKELCFALRRIILSSNSDEKNLWLVKSMRSSQFVKDRTTIWRRLNQFPADHQVPLKTVMVEKKIEKVEKVDIYLFNKVVDIGSIVFSLIQYNPCSKS